MLHRAGCFALPAIPGTIGLLLIFAGLMAEADRPARLGAFCLLGALVLLGAVLYLRWQGWIE